MFYLISYMFAVYVLFSSKLNKRYIGSTSNLDKRLVEHNSGKLTFNRGGIPWKLIYKEIYTYKPEARKRELFLKSGVGRKFLDQIIK